MICASFGIFFMSIIPLIINSSFELYLIEIFWVLLFTAFGYFCANINFSQMTYFYIICLYLKLKLRNANNSIRKGFEKKYKMTYYRMKNILISLNSIISEINTYNNDLWSKYLMIVLILVILELDLVLFEAVFGKISIFFKMIVIYFSSSLFLLLMILINTASSVSFEANKSYKLLNKLFVFNKKQISIRMRIKVWILKISFNINYTLILFFFAKCSDSCYHWLRESLRKILDFIVGKYLFSTIFVHMKWVLKTLNIS
jgi:hypothetical protein